MDTVIHVKEATYSHIEDPPARWVALPMVESTLASWRALAIASVPLLLETTTAQRWRALAVRDYESRALPLSYGGVEP